MNSGDRKQPGKPSICFVSLDNFAALMDDPNYGHIGGAEVQQATIARQLAKRGYRVSLVTLDHGPDQEMEVGGIRILKAYTPQRGIRGLRFVHPRLTGLWRAMRKADADFYYQRTRDSITGIVEMFCRWHHRKFIFAVASYFDCVAHPPGSARHVRILYRYGLRRADFVVAQTATQQRLLRENFGIDSTVVPNCMADCGRRPGEAYAGQVIEGRRFLWVGAFDPIKRLEWLLDVAKQLPECHFDVVGDGNRQSEYVRGLWSRAKAMPNVHLHGTVPHACVHQFYQRSAALICTSRSEGFPNTFLEAWNFGIPVVSTVDPDGVIVANGLGCAAHDVEGIKAGLCQILRSAGTWLEASIAARRYYLARHTPEACLPLLERLLLEAVA